MKTAKKGRLNDPKEPSSEREMPAYLATLTPKDWKPLFRFIPLLRAKKGLGKWNSPEKEDGVTIMPYCVLGSTEREFLKLVYRMRLVIPFDWGKWSEGRRLVRQDVSGLDLLTLLKLMTAIVRNDRYCEGALHSAMSNGVMLGILKAMKVRVEKPRVKKGSTAKRPSKKAAVLAT